MARLVELQSSFKKGMKQDTPRTSLPDGAAWSLVDWIPEVEAALMGRGGWAYGSLVLPDALTQITRENVLNDSASISATSYTTSNTLTPSVNKLYLCAVVSKCSSGTPNTPTMTGGGGLTWVQVATIQVATGRTLRLTLFRAMKSSGLSSGTLVISFGGQTTTQVIVAVTECNNTDTTGTNGSGAIVQSATATSATGTTASVTLAAFGDATNNAAFLADLNEQGVSVTPEAGYTELSDVTLGGDNTLQTESKIGEDLSPSASWVGSQNWAAIGCEIKAHGTVITPNYVAAGAYAPFVASPKLCAISDTGVLATVDTSTLATTSIGISPTPLQTAFHNDKLIITGSSGTDVPYYFDGATVGALGGSPPAAKYAVVYRDRTVLAGSTDAPATFYFSEPGDPQTWDLVDSYLTVSAPVTGMAALPGALMVFMHTRTARIRGSTPPPDTDMIEEDPIFNIGCDDARSISVSGSVCAFANAGGVYLTNGTNLPTDLTKACGIKRYWQSIMTSYNASTWMLVGGFYQFNWYVIAIMNGSSFVDAFMINIDSFEAHRLSNFTATCFFSGTAIAEEMWFGLRDEAKLGRFSTVMTPSSSYKSDADGTAVIPALETAMYGALPAGQKSWKSVYLQYDLRDAASDNPSWAVSYAKNPHDNYTALGTISESTDRTRSRIPMRFQSDGICFKILQTNPAANVRLYGIQADVHTREQSRIT